MQYAAAAQAQAQAQATAHAQNPQPPPLVGSQVGGGAMQAVLAQQQAPLGTPYGQMAAPALGGGQFREPTAPVYQYQGYAASAMAPRAVYAPPQPKQRVARVSASKTYKDLYARLPQHPTEQDLIAEFLRDELRSLLKANRVSYHKGGPQNLMKSKAEMAADLMRLVHEGKLVEEPPASLDDDGHGHGGYGGDDDSKRKKRRRAARPEHDAAPQQPRPPPFREDPGRLTLQLDGGVGLHPPPLGSPLGGPATPRTREAAEIILGFPPITPRSRASVIAAAEAASGESEVPLGAPLGR